MPFINRNVCKNFSIPPAQTKAKLANQECSEVVVVPTGGSATVFDYMNPNVGFVVPTGVEFTFRGLTNSDQVSATTGAGVTLSYRTQFFSFFPEVR